MARGDANHWQAWDASSKLVRIELEHARYEAALARCPALIELAAKMGEGGEAPFSEAMRALARFGLGAVGSTAEVERALQALEAIDAKVLFAYALALAAEIDLDAGRVDAAEARAAHALEQATAIGRRSEITWAEVLLARVAIARGDLPAARRRLAAIRGEPSASSFVR